MNDDDDIASGPTQHFLARVGGEIRRRRKAAGLTVLQLADAAALSRRMLTQIELGQANPSLTTVDKIARALQTDFASLARDTGPGAIVVNASGSIASLWSSPAGSRATLHIASSHRPPAELWEWVLQPGEHYDAQPDPTGSEELFLVLTGTLTITGDGFDPVTLPRDASARLSSDRRYTCNNRGNTPVRFVRVVQLQH